MDNWGRDLRSIFKSICNLYDEDSINKTQNTTVSSKLRRIYRRKIYWVWKKIFTWK